MQSENWRTGCRKEIGLVAPGRGCTCLEVPWQQFSDAVDRMITDACKYADQVSFRVQTIQLGRADQTVNRSGTFTTGIGAGEEIILPAECDGAQCPLGRIVVDLQQPIIAIAHKGRPAS